MIALVRGVTRAATDAGSSHGSVSAGDVGEHRRRAGVGDRIRRGDERQRRDDDLVARPEPGRHRHEVQRRGAVRHRHGVLGAGVGGERLLELPRCAAPG